MRKSISISISLMPDVLTVLDELAAQQHSTRSKCIADLIWSRTPVSAVKEVQHEKTKEQQSEQS